MWTYCVNAFNLLTHLLIGCSCSGGRCIGGWLGCTILGHLELGQLGAQFLELVVCLLEIEVALELDLVPRLVLIIGRLRTIALQNVKARV